MPRMTGCGGGVAAVFRKKRFELLTFGLRRPRPALVAATCRPLKYHKDFNQDFSNLSADTVPRYDHIFIVGDFNMCVGPPIH